MTKRFLIGIVAVAVVLSVPQAHAKDAIGLASGNLTTADACGFGAGFIGGFVGLGDEATSLFGTVTYGFSDYTDGRIRFGFSDLDAPGADPQLLLGVDFKYELMDYQDKIKNYPFDLATGIFFEYVNYDGLSTIEFGGNLIGSIPYKFESGYRIIPYSRLNFRLERVSADIQGEDDDTHSDFQAGLNLGVKFELSHDLSLYGELQIDGNTGLFTGLEMRAF